MLGKLLLRIISPIPDLSGFNRYVFIGPHPDDIEIGAGATAARLCEMGKTVHFIVCTDGGYGADNTEKTPDEVANCRKIEAEEAAKFLGVKGFSWLGFADGGLYSEDDMMQAIAKQLAIIKPDIVISLDPHLKTECHPDHLKVARAAASAYILCGNPLFAKAVGAEGNASPKALSFYYTDKPNSYVRISKSHRQKQLSALAIHKSQAFMDQGGKPFIDYMRLYFPFRSLRMGLRSFKGHAEAFRTLTNIVTHCCCEKV